MDKRRKKILFVIPDYIHGGTNKTLENLLSFTDKSKYDVSIYCIREDGSAYYRDVFKPYVVRKSKLFYWLHDNCVTRKAYGFLMKINSRFTWRFLYKHETGFLDKRHNYDIVVAYQEGAPTDFVYYFNSKLKISWFHSPSIKVLTRDLEDRTRVYSEFDKIVCVSDNFANQFRKTIPSLASKVVRIYNTMNAGLVNEMANSKIDDARFSSDGFTIISVGRFAPMKQFELIPSIVDKIKRIAGIPSFRWYIIASGSECRLKTEMEIKRFGLEDVVVLLGAKDNPYPYMKNADLFVSTSSTESFPTVINESKVLHTPVVSNNYPSAREILDDRCGLICSLEDMPEIIGEMIIDKDGIYSKLKRSISDYWYDNKSIMSQVGMLFDNKS